MTKRRVTVSIDESLVDEASHAVDEGRAESVSAWISEAMAARASRDRRLSLLAALVSDYEAEHGEITDDELAEQSQADRDAAAATRTALREPE